MGALAGSGWCGVCCQILVRRDMCGECTACLVHVLELHVSLCGTWDDLRSFLRASVFACVSGGLEK